MFFFEWPGFVHECHCGGAFLCEPRSDGGACPIGWAGATSWLWWPRSCTAPRAAFATPPDFRSPTGASTGGPYARRHGASPQLHLLANSPRCPFPDSSPISPGAESQKSRAVDRESTCELTTRLTSCSLACSVVFTPTGSSRKSRVLAVGAYLLPGAVPWRPPSSSGRWPSQACSPLPRRLPELPRKKRRCHEGRIYPRACAALGNRLAPQIR